MEGLGGPSVSTQSVRPQDAAYEQLTSNSSWAWANPGKETPSTRARWREPICEPVRESLSVKEGNYSTSCTEKHQDRGHSTSGMVSVGPCLRPVRDSRELTRDPVRDMGSLAAVYDITTCSQQRAYDMEILWSGESPAKVLFLYVLTSPKYYFCKS